MRYGGQTSAKRWVKLSNIGKTLPNIGKSLPNVGKSFKKSVCMYDYWNSVGKGIDTYLS